MSEFVRSDFPLSPVVTVGQFCASRRGDALGIVNRLPAEYLPNAIRICDLSQRLGAALGRVFVLTSGYRCPVLNAAVGGSTHSAHCIGSAIDGFYLGVASRDVCRLLESSFPDATEVELRADGFHVAALGSLLRRYMVQRVKGGPIKIIPSFSADDLRA